MVNFVCVLSPSVVSDSLRSHGLLPTRFLYPWDCFREEYWSGLSFPPLEDLPDPGIKPVSPVSPASQADSLPTEPPGKPFVLWSLYSIPVGVCSVVLDFLQSCGLHTACQPALPIEFSRQGNKGGLPFSSPGDLSKPGIKPASFVSLAMAGRFFTTMPTGRPDEF